MTQKTKKATQLAFSLGFRIEREESVVLIGSPAPTLRVGGVCSQRPVFYIKDLGVCLVWVLSKPL